MNRHVNARDRSFRHSVVVVVLLCFSSLFAHHKMLEDIFGPRASRHFRPRVIYHGENSRNISIEMFMRIVMDRLREQIGPRSLAACCQVEISGSVPSVGVIFSLNIKFNLD